jgi:hypothetical protein
LGRFVHADIVAVGDAVFVGIAIGCTAPAGPGLEFTIVLGAGIALDDCHPTVVIRRFEFDGPGVGTGSISPGAVTDS